MQYIHGNGEIDCCEDVGIQRRVILSEIGLNKCVWLPKYNDYP